MSTFTFIPDFGASADYEPRVRRAQFGDGYQQRVGDGINPLQEKWSLRFSYRDDAEATAILAFLTARAGVQSFQWTPPLETTPITVVCPSWQRTTDRHNLNTVTAEFYEVPEL